MSFSLRLVRTQSAQRSLDRQVRISYGRIHIMAIDHKVKKVIIPVGGFGTRFLPATKAQPKEMLALVDKPVIQYLVEEAVESGIREVIFVTGIDR